LPSGSSNRFSVNRQTPETSRTAPDKWLQGRYRERLVRNASDRHPGVRLFESNGINQAKASMLPRQLSELRSEDLQERDTLSGTPNGCCQCRRPYCYRPTVPGGCRENLGENAACWGVYQLVCAERLKTAAVRFPRLVSTKAAADDVCPRERRGTLLRRQPTHYREVYVLRWPRLSMLKWRPIHGVSRSLKGESAFLSRR